MGIQRIYYTTTDELGNGRMLLIMVVVFLGEPMPPKILTLNLNSSELFWAILRFWFCGNLWKIIEKYFFQWISGTLAKGSEEIWAIIRLFWASLRGLRQNWKTIQLDHVYIEFWFRHPPHHQCCLKTLGDRCFNCLQRSLQFCICGP